MIFLEFEKPLESLFEQLDKIKDVGNAGDLDVLPMVKKIETRIKAKQKEIYSNLTGWEKVQLSRHPERPYTMHYIKAMSKKFVELHGDRCFADDKAMVGGLASLDGMTVMIIGQQKGENTKMRQYRNFGMAHPEGYRKALRLMKLAEKFDIPVVTLIDTPGAYPGIGGEERGQAEAIAKNMFEMAQLRVPIVCVVIGEGASGGAIGIGLGDRLYMMENTWYSVIAPESCSSILWRSWDHKEKAAEALKLTADDMLKNELIDDIIKEPLGGAHQHPIEMAKILKRHLKKVITELQELDPEDRINKRIAKYEAIGQYEYAEVK